MSRVAKQPVTLPQGVEFNVADGMITIKGSDLQPVPDVLPESQRALAKAIVATDDQMICFLDPEPLVGIELQGLAA